MKGSLEYDPKVLWCLPLWGPEAASRGGDPASEGHSGCETDKLCDLSDWEGRLEGGGSFVELHTALCGLSLGPQAGVTSRPVREADRSPIHSSLVQVLLQTAF